MSYEQPDPDFAKITHFINVYEGYSFDVKSLKLEYSSERRSECYDTIHDPIERVAVVGLDSQMNMFVSREISVHTTERVLQIPQGWGNLDYTHKETKIRARIMLEQYYGMTAPLDSLTLIKSIPWSPVTNGCVHVYLTTELTEIADCEFEERQYNRIVPHQDLMVQGFTHLPPDEVLMKSNDLLTQACAGLVIQLSSLIPA